MTRSGEIFVVGLSHCLASADGTIFSISESVMRRPRVQEISFPVMREAATLHVSYNNVMSLEFLKALHE